MKRRDLERALEAVPDFEDPDPDREQYRTPAAVAADLLWQAALDGAIDGKAVLDLGCGTGMFARGAVLLGAARVVGVDQDPAALATAQEVVPEASLVQADLAQWHPDPPGGFDTVLMNPPFGAQKGNRGGDRVFYDRAKEAVVAAGAAGATPGGAAEPRDGPGPTGGTVWFLAQPRTERFLAAYARGLGGHLERVAQWDYPIEARFAFHGKPVQRFHVAGYRMGF